MDRRLFLFVPPLVASCQRLPRDRGYFRRRSGDRLGAEIVGQMSLRELVLSGLWDVEGLWDCEKRVFCRPSDETGREMYPRIDSNEELEKRF